MWISALNSKMFCGEYFTSVIQFPGPTCKCLFSFCMFSPSCMWFRERKLVTKSAQSNTSWVVLCTSVSSTRVDTTGSQQIWDQDTQIEYNTFKILCFSLKLLLIKANIWIKELPLVYSYFCNETLNHREKMRPTENGFTTDFCVQPTSWEPLE